jgi:AraC family transcriptional regulator, regulatory protein of adaptative response / DNA-3-methyladenine glycosylase II
MVLDDEQCWRAAQARDHRFDGRFFVGVRTTGIYCRPSCPTPVAPLRKNIDFHPSAAAAQQAGLRACKRCRPDTIGNAPWNSRDDLVGRAIRLIDEGTIDRDGVSGLARKLFVSERHLTRVLTEHLGAGPLALARAQRAGTARTLIETTNLSFGDITFASGFSSIRQFNETLQSVYALSPTDLRASSGTNPPSGPAVPAGRDLAGGFTMSLRLNARLPFDHESIFNFLGTRSIPGVEQAVSIGVELSYARSLILPGGPALFMIRTTPLAKQTRSYSKGRPLFPLQLSVSLTSMSDLGAVIARVKRLFDLDADASVIADVLGSDPGLRMMLDRHPGRRAPGAVEAHELAIRAVLGQQVSVAAARTLAARLSAKVGSEIPLGLHVGGLEGVTHLFPTMSALAALPPEEIGIPMARARALIGLAAALANGSVDLSIGADRDAARAALVALPGIGRWTAGYITMRALSDPDVFLDDDLAVLNGAKALGIATTSKELERWGQAFRPFRSYVTHLLWAACPPPAPKKPKAIAPKRQELIKESA